MLTDRTRTLLASAVGLFWTSAVVGFLLVPDVGATVDGAGELQSIQNAAFGYIVYRNAVVLVLLLAGSFTFGLTTFLNLTVNGVMLGASVAEALAKGASVKAVFALVAPHAIVELPAFWLASTIGFGVPYVLVEYFRENRPSIFEREELREFARLLFVSVVLLVVAAAIEAYVTPMVAQAIV